jgi:uncharacterized protein (TIGR03435 family)
MTSLSRGMERRLGRPVIDKTGLTSAYDFNLMWAEESAATRGEAAAALPTLAGAFEDQLGLKLTSARGSIQALVVDRLSKTPTEN